MTFFNDAHSRHLLAATLGFLMPLGVTLPSVAGTITTVDFSSFDEEGNVSSSIDYATLSTKNASDDRSSDDDPLAANPLANFLNVDVEDLDDPNDLFNGSAVKGSAIREQSFNANAGDTFRFDWTFETDDPDTFDGTGDYAFVTTDENQAPFDERIVSISEGDFDSNNQVTGNFKTTFSSDNPTIALGIVELQGTPQNSSFQVTNGEIESSEAVPFETSSEVGALVLAGGIASIAWRRYRRRIKN